MSPFDLHPKAPSGLCPFCNGEALYTKITCDNCGVRLPWADGDADRMGGNCPNCRKFNVYARTNCQQCSALLPWHECMAAIYHAKHNINREFASMAFSIIVACLLILGGIVGVAWFSAPHQ